MTIQTIMDDLTQGVEQCTIRCEEMPFEARVEVNIHAKEPMIYKRYPENHGYRWVPSVAELASGSWRYLGFPEVKGLEEAKPEVCGNKNHGWKARMTCVLPKGHAGNHEDSVGCWWRG